MTTNQVLTAERTTALVNVANAPSAGCGCGAAGEVDAGSCKAAAGEFPRFFAGQLVQPDDLTAIEKRVFFHEQLRARHLFGWGIACGFRVGVDGTVGQINVGGVVIPTTLVAGAQVRVESGYGLDRYGRDVYMPADRTLSLETLFAEREARIAKAMGDPWCVIPGCQPTPPTHFCLAVRYKECPEKPVPSYAQQCGTPKTLCEYSRIREDVEVRLFGDNEFPGGTTATPAKNWCGVPPRSAALFERFGTAMQYPDAAAVSGAAHAAFAQLATNVQDRVNAQEGPNCDDLLHAPRPCEPCVDTPWIPIACFTRDGDSVYDLDCGVRRVLYSLQEIETVLVRIFCALIDRDTAAPTGQVGLAQSQPSDVLKLLQ